MFANIRRHQKWLWYVISAAVIISFTWYLNPANRQNRGGAGGDAIVGSMNGLPIHRSEYLDTVKEAYIKYLFTFGTWYGSDEFSRQNEGFIERDAKQRLFLNEKARELGIHVTAQNVADWIREQFGREKPFTEAEYNQLLKNLGTHSLDGHAFTETDLNRFVRGEIAAQHLVQVAGTPGRLVTPQEAEAQYRREHQQVSAEGVFFNASNYVAKVNLDPANISRYYTNQAQNFREPDKIQVSYVEFPATNATFLAEADKTFATITNLNERIEEIYRRNGTNFYTDANGLPMTPDAAKAKIKEDQRKQIALVEARKAATAFAEDLLAMTNSVPGQPKAARLDQLAKQKGMTVKVTEPFSQFEPPKGIEANEKFNQVAFALTPDEPFIEQPIVGEDAVYIAALNKKIPSHIPPLAEIQEKVTEDYKRSESRKLATAAGQEFYTKLIAAMATGKAFNAAAFELGNSVTMLAPFSTVTRTIPGLDPRVDPSTVKNTAFALKEGETSQFISTRDGGFVLHVNKFVPVTDSEVKSALPEYLANLRKSGQSEAFNEWFSKEYQAAKVVLNNDKRSEKGGAQSSDTQ